MEKTYKRTSRYTPQEVKEKISNKLKGRRKPDSTKIKISQSMKEYWGNDNNFPDDYRHDGNNEV